ncbi:MAG TPA: sulfurtransferase TusA family protein [Wenzhouxiangellaceae bacterium]|nr:sulfurtransferase TusA family protein [Wenzhouxiangellaceae bacterium]
MNSAKPDKTLDATGLACPEPVFRTRRALAEMAAGQLLLVSADDPLVEMDMAVFCQRTDHRMVSRTCIDGCWTFLLRKADA